MTRADHGNAKFFLGVFLLLFCPLSSGGSVQPNGLSPGAGQAPVGGRVRVFGRPERTCCVLLWLLSTLPNMSNVQKVDIAWSAVSCSVELKVDSCVSRVHVLKDVSGYARAGKITTIMGPSGAGKTTMVRFHRTGGHRVNLHDHGCASCCRCKPPRPQLRHVFARGASPQKLLICPLIPALKYTRSCAFQCCCCCALHSGAGLFRSLACLYTVLTCTLLATPDPFCTLFPGLECIRCCCALRASAGLFPSLARLFTELTNQ